MKRRRLCVALAIGLGLGGLLLAGPPTAADDALGARAFETPEAAAKAIIAAAKANDDAAIVALMGPEFKDLVQSATDPKVAKNRAEFAKRAEAKLTFEDNEDGSKTMVIGRNQWPMPVPLVKTEGGWQFDAAAGREEVLARRIGDNELTAIRICRRYAQAQIEYASKDRDGDRVREYAQRLRSRPGKKDGLYWEAAEGEDASPFGPFVEAARDYVEGRKAGDPVGGYVWQIQSAQGSSAPGGRHSYIINGNMIAGFALIGYPATYDSTGVMTFLVSHHGQVLQKDLGPDTKRRAGCLYGYDPDSSWTQVKED